MNIEYAWLPSTQGHGQEAYSLSFICERVENSFKRFLVPSHTESLNFCKGSNADVLLKGKRTKRQGHICTIRIWPMLPEGTL